MATKVFRDTDAGALVLNGVAGSFAAIMKSCLLQAGWTVAWEDVDAGKLVMRNSLLAGGSGCFVRILDSAANYAYIQVFEDMSGLDAGSGSATTLANGVIILKSSAASAAARAWVVFADAITFYGCIAAGGATFPTTGVEFADSDTAVPLHTAFGGGNFASIVGGDPAVFVAGRSATGISSSVPSALGRCGAANDGFSVSRNGGLVLRPSTAYLGRLDALAKVLYSADGITSKAHSFASGDISSADLSEAAIPAFVGTEDGGFRGRMRGLYVPMGARNSARSASETVGNIFDLPQPMGVIRGYGSGPGTHINASWYLFVSQGDWS